MQTGTLKKFFEEKGFGFIQPDNGSPDLFAHKRALSGGNEAAIREGSKVTFLTEIEDRTGKPKASTWSIIDGGAAQALGAMAGAMGAMGGVAPDYGALAAASFGAFGMPAGHNQFSPYGAMGAMAPMMPAGLPPGWEQVADPTTGKPYYCNRATGESSWTVPVGAAPAMTMMPAMAPVAAMPMPTFAAETPTLPAGWESAADPSSGKPYYFNRATGETKWEIPTA